MTSLTPASASLEGIAAVTTTAGSSESTGPWLHHRLKTRRVSAFSSGNPEFDQMLDRLHVAFGELARTDDDTSSAASEAASDLSTSYTTMTGRQRPDADASAGALAAALQRGLSGLPASLTDQTGQSMLRAL